ncbi:MAG: hypothetical protein H6661_10655 [Ardenticatenaceae bacterium]|nr:hypothetical protein [Ardenticatenaceae bacterium]
MPRRPLYGAFPARWPPHAAIGAIDDATTGHTFGEFGDGRYGVVLVVEVVPMVAQTKKGDNRRRDRGHGRFPTPQYHHRN